MAAGNSPRRHAPDLSAISVTSIKQPEEMRFKYTYCTDNRGFLGRRQLTRAEDGNRRKDEHATCHLIGDSEHKMNCERRLRSLKASSQRKSPPFATDKTSYDDGSRGHLFYKLQRQADRHRLYDKIYFFIIILSSYVDIF